MTRETSSFRRVAARQLGVPAAANPPPRVGTFGWLNATQGVIEDPLQRLRLVGHIYREAPAQLADRLAATAWRRLPNASRSPVLSLTTPSSPLARDAEALCRHTLGTAMFNHSVRTWLFGTALARRDGQPLDDELFFVTSMLHDLGLARSTYAQCFTLAGATAIHTLAQQHNTVGSDAVDAIATAISDHITPGLRVDKAGPMAVYLQRGSLLDLTGARVVKLSRRDVQRVYDDHPSLGIKREVAARWRAEADLVRHGRAHLLQRWGCFSCWTRLCPLPPR